MLCAPSVLLSDREAEPAPAEAGGAANARDLDPGSQPIEAGPYGSGPRR